ncbi:MAG: hypothetical protein H7A33_00855 [Deltaproteobacteria bacterium]|nr:hypothetical protein [Deltaproteobacteria bacterium]
MTINNDNRSERDEERRVDERRQEAKRQNRLKAEREPMRTFEAKLSEKTADEVQKSQSQFAKQLKDSKKSKEEKQGLLDKIIGVAKDKNKELDQAHVDQVRHQEEHHQEEQEFLKEDNQKYEERLDDKSESTSKAKTSEKGETSRKEGEISNEGYRRVAEKSEGDGGSSSGGFAGSDGSAGEGQSHLGKERDSSQNQQKGQSLNDFKKATVKAIRERLGSGAQGFDRNARDFSEQDLSEIITSVEFGLNDSGQEEFVVQLSDEYFDGLKVATERTKDGVVLRFFCPNRAVKSTFLKQRPLVHMRLKKKGIKVLRIDVV